jgi:hypothetical protein
VKTVEMLPAVGTGQKEPPLLAATASLKSSSLLLRIKKNKKIYINFKLFEQFSK